MCRCISKTQKNRQEQDQNLCFRRAQLNTTCCHRLLLDLNNLNCHARRARAARVIIRNAVIKGSFQRETLSIDKKPSSRGNLCFPRLCYYVFPLPVLMKKPRDGCARPLGQPARGLRPRGREGSQRGRWLRGEGSSQPPSSCNH